MPHFLAKLKPLLGLDFRSLALFRMALAGILLIDLLDRAADLAVHYSDGGVLPRFFVLEQYTSPWNVSIYWISGNPGVVAALMIFAAICAVALLLGHRTRMATLLSWFMLMSIHRRNPIVLYGGDDLFRMLLFWAMFLPLGKRWSLDSLRSPSNPDKDNGLHYSIAAFALICQIVIVYVFNNLQKTGLEWRVEYSAVYYALNIDQFTLPLGAFLLKFPELLKYVTMFVVNFELIGPVLLFCPVANGPIRTFTIFLFMMMHLGFGLTMKLDLFPWMCAAAFTSLLPPWFWDQVFSPLTAKLKGFEQNWIHKFKRGDSFPEIQGEMGGQKYILKQSRHWFREVGALAALIIIIVWNISDIFPDHVNFPPFLRPAINFFYLDQYWNMFSPKPLVDDGWYVIPGKLKSGEEVDVLHPAVPVVWEKPKLVSSTYRNCRWQKYMMNLWLKNYEDYRLYFGKYLCQNWNRKHSGDRQMEGFEMNFMLEPTPPFGKPLPAPEKITIWKHHCFDKPQPPAAG